MTKTYSLLIFIWKYSFIKWTNKNKQNKILSIKIEFSLKLIQHLVLHKPDYSYKIIKKQILQVKLDKKLVILKLVNFKMNLLKKVFQVKKKWSRFFISSIFQLIDWMRNWIKKLRIILNLLNKIQILYLLFEMLLNLIFFYFYYFIILVLIW